MFSFIIYTARSCTPTYIIKRFHFNIFPVCIILPFYYLIMNYYILLYQTFIFKYKNKIQKYFNSSNRIINIFTFSTEETWMGWAKWMKNDLVKFLCKLIFFLFNLIIVKNITMVFPILKQKHQLFFKKKPFL